MAQTLRLRRGPAGPRAGAMLLAGIALLVSAAVWAETPRLPEYQVKAAFLLNFTRYVEWPAAAFEDENAPFGICVVEPDQFGEQLDATMAGRTSQGRPLRVSRIARITDAADCHLLFIGRDADASRDTLSALGGRPILTVGEADHFLTDGGGVELLIVGDTVQFGVNLEATGRADLMVSSRMLMLARRVIGSRRPRGER